ncbi:MAG: hypothetical protein GPJ54_18195 [Candidatus Heimdallarchaeota archaeon]|nr:hypothetical protein [Candidatus Heimdallarchaeota archaeon]
MTFQELLEYSDEVSKIISTWEGVIQIAYKMQSDALIAASTFGKSFYDLDKPCVLFEIDEKTNLKKLIRRDKFPTIILGLPLSTIRDEIENFTNPILLINNEAINDRNDLPENIILLNSANYGFYDLDTSLSACAYFICSFIVPNLDEIVKFPLIAFHALNLYKPYEGLHELISQDAQSGNIITINKKLSLLGGNLFSISESIIYSNHPYLPGLSGNESEVDKLIAKADIEIKSGKKLRKLNELSREETTDLNNLFIIFLTTQVGYQRDDLFFIKEMTHFNNENEASITNSVWDFATAINDSINRNLSNTALAVLLGNRSNHLIKLNKLFLEERKAVFHSYQLIHDKRAEIEELSCLRYFIADRKVNWYNVSIAAALALSKGLVTSELPFAVVSPGPDKKQTIGIRISKNIISESLKNVIEKVCEKLDVNTDISGTNLEVQFSVKSDDVDPILMQINAYLMNVM